MMIEKEEQLLKKRILELAANCFQRDIPLHTDFLTLHEQTIFHSIRRELPLVRFLLAGGYEGSERKIVCFLASYEDETAVLPISMLKARPANSRFAEKLTHRDYLGAMMNLGIERRLIGDILMKEGSCFIFCMEKMADYIVDNLIKVKHTPVVCEKAEQSEIQATPDYEQISGSVASPRLDNLLSLVFKTSRTKTVPYIDGEKVFIDGRLTTSAGTQLKGGEIVSVRGLGKFLYVGVENETKKGRLFVTAQKYR